MALRSVRSALGVGLVGRERERAELWEAVDGAARAHGCVWLVRGEPGIGKTSLLGAVAEAAGPTDVRVVWGRCWEGGGAPAFWPWVQVLRAAMTGLDDHVLSARLGPGAADLAALVPEMAGRLSGHAATPELDPGARFRLFDNVVTFLVRTAADAPLLIVLDDLHAADEASLLLLAFVARQIAREPLAVIGAYRDAEVRASSRLSALLADVARHGSRLTLAGLDADSIITLIEAALGGPAPADVVARVSEVSEGNPFLVKELARLLPTRGGRPRPGDRLPLPEEARAIVARRLDALADDVRSVLGAAAVLGRDFDLAPLAGLTGRAAIDILDVLHEARGQGVVEEAGAGRWSFSHALLREILYEALSPSIRVVLHRRAAEALDDHGAAHVAAVAHHRYEAARAGDQTGAAEACAAAGAGAMDALAYEDAAGWYERALEVLALSPALDERLHYDLCVALGQARFSAGQLGAARDAYRPAVASARSLADPERFAEAALGFFGLPRSDGEAITLLKEALAGLPDGDSALRARLLIALGSVFVAARDSGWRRWATMCDEAVVVARRVGDRKALAAVLGLWHRSHLTWSPVDVDRRLAAADELLALTSTRDREPEWRMWAHLWCFCDHLERGDLPAARAQAEIAAAEAHELRLPPHVVLAGYMRMSLAILAGDLDGAEALARRADAASKGSLEDFPVLLLALEVLHWLRGELRDARSLRDRRLSAAPWVPPPIGDLNGRAVVVSYSTESGDEAAARELEAVVTDVLGWPGAPLDGACLAYVAQACWTIGFSYRVEQLHAAMRPYAGRLVVDDAIPLGVADRHLGQLAALAGRWEEAEGHLGAAHALCRRWGAPGFLAHGQADHARMLLMRDGPGDRQRAADLVAEAVAGFRSLGMTYFEEQAAKLAAEAGAVAAPAAPERGTFQREGEYWCVAYGGRVVRLRDAKGLRYLARLLAEPGRELHALDLTGHGSFRARAEVAGDAGAVLDAVAKAAYRRRLAELEADADEADAACDLGRAERVAVERDFLVAELAAAVGLGGRDRVAASATERARQSVTRAVRGAVARLADAHPDLGRHLEATVRTGVYCTYAPDPRVPMTWE